MIRICTDAVCPTCRRRPSFGWLYACIDEHDTEAERLPNPSILSAIDTTNFNDDLESWAVLAEFLMLRPDVVASIRAGEYTSEQISSIVESKKAVVRAAYGLEQPVHPGFDEAAAVNASTSTPTKMSAADASRRSLGSKPPDTPVKTGSFHNSEQTSPPTIQTYVTLSRRAALPPGVKVNLPGKDQTCRFQCCHRCKPFLVERATLSLNSIVIGDLTAAERVKRRLIEEETATLTMPLDATHDPRSVFNHGRILPSDSPESSFSSQSDEDESSGNDSFETESEFEIMVAELRQQIVMSNDSAVSVQ
jgi:hypothetical protein